MMRIKSLAKVATKLLIDADTFLLYCIAVFSVVIFAFSYSFPQEAARFPQAVSVFTFFMIVLEFITRYKKKKKIEAEDIAETKEGKESKDQQLEKKEVGINWLLVLMLVIVYYLLLKPVGFYPVTIVYLLISPWLLGYRNKKVIILTAVIATITVWLIFGRFFYVPLPMGIFG